MDPRFLPHNAHRDDPDAFRDLDPQLRALGRQRFVARPRLLDRLPTDQPGLYSLGGGRQVGKTTLLKLWMAQLLERGTDPARIAYLTGELIDDHHSLVRLLQEIVGDAPGDGVHTLIIDEVTFIRGWERALKFAADAGLLEDTVLVFTGSDLSLVREARTTFPGRRGTADEVDFELWPLSFRDVVQLKRPDLDLDALALEGSVQDPDQVDVLYALFDDYLIHGGFLTAINDLAANGSIRPATLATYSDWIRGDMRKRGKRESYLREVLSAVRRRAGSQVTYNALARDLSIDHPATVADYIEQLTALDVLFVQPALLEDKLVGAPKKARKVHFSDPFVHHAVRHWLQPVERPFEERILIDRKDPRIASTLVEACVASHLRRRYPTYYIKAAGEVDVAYVDGERFWPIEIKWRRQLHPKDLKQVAKYPNARIWSRARTPGVLREVPVEPLPLALSRLG